MHLLLMSEMTQEVWTALRPCQSQTVGSFFIYYLGKCIHTTQFHLELSVCTTSIKSKHK